MIQDILSFPLWILSAPGGGFFIESFLKLQLIVSFILWFIVEWKLSGDNDNT